MEENPAKEEKELLQEQGKDGENKDQALLRVLGGDVEDKGQGAGEDKDGDNQEDYDNEDGDNPGPDDDKPDGKGAVIM